MTEAGGSSSSSSRAEQKHQRFSRVRRTGYGKKINIAGRDQGTLCRGARRNGGGAALPWLFRQVIIIMEKAMQEFLFSQSLEFSR